MICSTVKTSIKSPIAVTLITGLLGSGKTSLIRQLLKQKPPHENWALLINEFGEIGIDAPALQTSGLPIFEVNGGCICCSAQNQLARALDQITTLTQLDRLIIEPTGLGHPAQIIDTLTRQSKHFALQNSLCVVDSARFNNQLWQKSAVLRDMINLGDVIVLNKTDLITAETQQQIVTFLANLTPPKTQVICTQHGDINAETIQQTYARPPFLLLQSRQHELTPGLVASFHSELPQVQSCMIHKAEPASIGWVFSPNILFKRPQFKNWFNSPPPGLVRAKGLLRMGKQWQLLSWVDGILSLEEIAWRADSRLEMIFQSPPNPPDLEKMLFQLLQVRDL